MAALFAVGRVAGLTCIWLDMPTDTVAGLVLIGHLSSHRMFVCFVSGGDAIPSTRKQPHHREIPD